MIKEEEELRVIYTALTRTSKYSFITASNKDSMKPDHTIKHPHFEHLQKAVGSEETVPFD
jgi:superfamily I DNA/RNA helicase